jgi:hypothetical protein
MDIAEDPSCNSHQLEDRPTSDLIFISLSGQSRRAVSLRPRVLVLKSSPSSLLEPGRPEGLENMFYSSTVVSLFNIVLCGCSLQKRCIHKELMTKFLPDRTGCRDWAFREATEATLDDLKVGKLAWEILTARRC